MAAKHVIALIAGLAVLFVSSADAQRGAGQGARAGGAGAGPRGGGAPRQAQPGQRARRGGAAAAGDTAFPSEFAGTGLAAEIGRAQRVSGVETRTYILEETGEEMAYSVYVSRKVDKDKPSPLVIALHGMGGHPTTIISQIRDEANRHGYIVVAPMGYNPNGGYGAYPAGLGRTPDPRANVLSEIDVMNVLACALEEFNVDERRIYVLGQSMGGAGALHLGRKYGHIWAAVGATAPAVGGAEPRGLENVRDLPFIIVAGEADPGIPVERTRRWAAKLEQLGMTYEYYEIRRGGHADAIIKGAAYVFDFFDKHTRPESNVDQSRQ